MRALAVNRLLRRTFAFGFIATLCLLAPTAVHAQYASAQDSTLRGLKKVYVNFGVSDGAMPEEAAEELLSSVTLELRKAGIHVAKDTTELDMTQDAILNISFVKLKRSLSDDAIFRIDLEQRATLIRTKQTTRMVTWFYEQNGQNVDPPQFFAAAEKKGVDDFLSHWLDMNGR